MSVVEWTGRAVVRTMRCWRCGQSAEHVLYEIRDMQADVSGTERMCCDCGKSTHGWGWEHRFWLGERQKELVRALLVALWLADQIVQSVGRSSAEQLRLFEAVSG
ncbi:hypothetical protein ACFWWC_03735 [Streptomyces sp. NPDC058642]|uniref:hypothetical protein n=1 Tax=Streptomyces sp. NPDC058642 TaxID=3346572 RepID=UPI0036681C26